MIEPRLKAQRADSHIQELEKVLSKYISANARAINTVGKRTGRKSAVSKLGLVLPSHTPTIIGDIIHNLRASLDYAYWLLVKNNGGEWHRSIKFPFGKDKLSIQGSLKGLKKTSLPSKSVQDFILEEIQPYENGKLGLYDLHRLDIIDKHQLLLPTYRRFTIQTGEEFSFIRSDGKSIIVRGGDETGPTNFIFTKPQQIMFITERQIQFSGSLRNAISVLFGEGPLERQEVISTLRNLSENTKTSIRNLEGFMTSK